MGALPVKTAPPLVLLTTTARPTMPSLEILTGGSRAKTERAAERLAERLRVLAQEDAAHDVEAAHALALRLDAERTLSGPEINERDALLTLRIALSGNRLDAPLLERLAARVPGVNLRRLAPLDAAEFHSLDLELGLPAQHVRAAALSRARAVFRCPRCYGCESTRQRLAEHFAKCGVLVEEAADAREPLEDAPEEDDELDGHFLALVRGRRDENVGRRGAYPLAMKPEDARAALVETLAVARREARARRDSMLPDAKPRFAAPVEDETVGVLESHPAEPVEAVAALESPPVAPVEAPDPEELLAWVRSLNAPDSHVERAAGLPASFLCRAWAGANRDSRAARSWAKLKAWRDSGAVLEVKPPRFVCECGHPATRPSAHRLHTRACPKSAAYEPERATAPVNPELGPLGGRPRRRAEPVLESPPAASEPKTCERPGCSQPARVGARGKPLRYCGTDCTNAVADQRRKERNRAAGKPAPARAPRRPRAARVERATVEPVVEPTPVAAPVEHVAEAAPVALPVVVALEPEPAPARGLVSRALRWLGLG